MQKLLYPHFLLPLSFIFSFGLFAQKNTVNISGYIKEQGSKEPLVGANTWLQNNKPVALPTQMATSSLVRHSSKKIH